MAETIINSNQVRQAGDSSSQTLLNKNQIAQSQGTLNAEIVGSLTNNNGIYSGFSKDNYIKLQTPFVPSNAFEIKIKFKFNYDMNNPLFHSCIDLNDSDRYGICLVIELGKINYFVSANGSSWLFDIYYNNSLSGDTDYWIKFGWSGTEYYCDLSIDGTTYSRVISFSSNTAPTSSIQYTTIGRYVDFGLNGTIDNNNTSITDNGTEYYLNII